jgi:hypothetical protein
MVKAQGYPSPMRTKPHIFKAQNDKARERNPEVQSLFWGERRAKPKCGKTQEAKLREKLKGR